MKSIRLFHVIFIYFMLVQLGCTSKTKVHPNFQYLPHDDNVAYSLDISGRNQEYLPDFFNPDSLKQNSFIGDNFPLNDEYNRIPLNFDIDPNGNIYIIHEQSNSINVYSDQGDFLYKIGNAGHGPGEFIELEGFSFNESYDMIYALDVSDIEIFTRINNKFEYETTISHNMIRAYDLCILDNYLFISGLQVTIEDLEAYHDGTKHRAEVFLTPPITRIDLNTMQSDTSFGFEYQSYSGWGSHTGRLSETILSCNPYTKTLIGYLRHFPYLFGYDEHGNQKWISKIDNYRSTTFEESSTPEGPSFFGYTNTDYFHYKYPTQKIDNDQYSILQFVNQPPQPHRLPHENFKVPGPDYHTIMIDTNTGELFYSDIYPYIGIKNENTVITVHRESELHPYIFKVNDL